MPGAGKLQSRVFQRMHVGGDGYFVVEAPAPFALAIQKVVDHALDNLAKCPRATRDWVLECLLPLRPGVFPLHGFSTLEQRPAGVEGLGNGGTQFAGERRNRLFDVHLTTVHLLTSEQLRELLENIFTDHGPASCALCSKCSSRLRKRSKCAGCCLNFAKAALRHRGKDRQTKRMSANP